MNSFENLKNRINSFSFVRSYKNPTKPLKKEWVFLCVLIGILFFSHLFDDIVISTRHGINVWTALSEGRFFQFYKDNTSPAAIYPFPIYIIFAVWNFPLWILQYFFKFDPYTSVNALMYAKCILIPFLFGTTKTVCNICKELSFSEEKSKWCAFYFLSSNLILYSVAVTGQYDIFAVYFILKGVHFYMKGDSKKFILYFIIANSLKLFALFIFIPLILLKQKKLYKIIFYIMLGLCLYTFASILFEIPETSKAIALKMISYLFLNTLPLTYLAPSIFVVATLIFWAWCYIKKPTKENLKILAIYLPFISMALLFVCSFTHLYWIILLSPFICILCFASSKYHQMCMFAETISCAAITLTLSFIGSITISLKTINNTFLSQIFGSVFPEDHMKVFGKYLNEEMIKNDTLMSFVPPLCTSFFVAGIIVFAVLSSKSALKGKIEDSKIDRNTIYSRLLLNIIVSGLTFILYFIF